MTVMSPCGVRFILAGLFVLVLSTAPRAQEVPPRLAGTKVVTADEVAKLQTESALIVDTRVAAEFSDGHIKGAVNIPYRERSNRSVGFDPRQDEFAVAKLPADKAAAIVFYCNGTECWKSYKSSVRAIEAGYTNLYWYRDGFPDWKAKGLPIE
jgi:rhodanese-related sulfurtransferase